MRIGVFYGGPSAEHEYSILTGLRACQGINLRHKAVPVYVTPLGKFRGGSQLLDPSSYDGDLEKVGKAITLEVHHNHLLIDGEYSLKISWALQAAHGHWGESGGLQGLLESANLRIIGSSPLASALGLDKEKTKVILQAANIPVVEGRNLSLGSTIEEFTEACLMVGFPCFVKAQHLGSSLGVERCHSLEEAHLARQKISHLDTHLLIEQKSRELNILVGCLGTKKTLTPLWHEP